MAAVTQTEAFAAGEPAAIMEYLRITEKVKFYDPDHLADYDIHDQLGAIVCPTLTIHGDHDPIPLESARRIHQGITGSTLTVMERCGHFPFIEDRAGFLALTNRFLDQVK